MYWKPRTRCTHATYLCSNKIVVRVCFLKHGQQALRRRNGALKVGTLSHLESLQDQFGSIQIFAQSLQLLQSTAAKEQHQRFVRTFAEF